jgi:hypothetical protein
VIGGEGLLMLSVRFYALSFARRESLTFSAENLKKRGHVSPGRVPYDASSQNLLIRSGVQNT